MWVDVGCAIASALFCTLAAWVVVGAGAPSWAAPIGALLWAAVLEFAIRTVVDEARAFYQRSCVLWSAMDQRERLIRDREEAERELDAATNPSQIRAAAAKRRLALQGLAWLDEPEAKPKRPSP
jgi:hypothetical protein